MSLWLLSELGWNKNGFDKKKFNKELVLNLIKSSNELDASNAYWKLEDQVCRNGLLSEVAHDVVMLILSFLPSCNNSVKVKCLELLGQIIVSEPEVSNSKVLDKCINEIYKISWWLLNEIEFGEPYEIWLHVDIIGVLALKFENFKYIAIVYLKNCLMRTDIPKRDLKMIQNTLNDIKDYWGQYPFR